MSASELDPEIGTDKICGAEFVYAKFSTERRAERFWEEYQRTEIRGVSIPIAKDSSVTRHQKRVNFMDYGPEEIDEVEDTVQNYCRELQYDVI